MTDYEDDDDDDVIKCNIYIAACLPMCPQQG